MISFAAFRLRVGLCGHMRAGGHSAGRACRCVLCLVAFGSVMALLMAGRGVASRTAPPEVAPVKSRGVRYVAPNADGRTAWVEAWDTRTGRKFATIKVFTNGIRPNLEEDVQWIFISRLQVSGNRLAVTDELGRRHYVALLQPPPATSGQFTKAVGYYPPLVFVRERSLWLRDSSGAERPLTRGYEDANPSVSRDGKLVVFERRRLVAHRSSRSGINPPHAQSAGSGSQLWLLDLSAGRQRLLVQAPGDCFGPSFDPTGARVYFQHVSDYAEQGQIWREAIATVDVRTGKWRDLPQLVIPAGSNGTEFAFAFPRLTKDGKWLVWSTIPHEAGWAEIGRARPDGTEKHAVSRPKKERGNQAASFWLATAYIRADRLACFETDCDELGNASAGIATIDLHGTVLSKQRIDRLEDYPPPPAVAPDGRLAFARYDREGGGTTSIWVKDPWLSAHVLTKVVRNGHQPSWAPRGSLGRNGAIKR